MTTQTITINDLWIDFGFHPPERQTADYPGYPGWVEIAAIRAEENGPNLITAFSDEHVATLEDQIMRKYKRLHGIMT